MTEQIIIKYKVKEMSSVADKNFYLVKGIVIGAEKTGKTTFLS
jgi:hypothetical protein